MDALTSAKNSKNKKTTTNMIKCNICFKVFTNRSSLAKHEPIHSADSPYECTICDYAGKTQQYLRRHVKVKHGARREFRCDVCGKTFHFGCKLKNHMRVHTGEKPYKCDECGKTFNASYSLNTHKLIHTGAKPYQCVFCAYACRDSSTLRKHQARHTGNEIHYKCKMCDISCKSKSILKLHVAEKHLEVDVRKFQCNTCGKRFKIKTNLAVHIQVVHERSRTIKCDVCGFLLSNRGNLPAHMRTHVEEKPFLCTVELCERRFKDTSSLRKHTLSHFPEKHLACDICRKRFMSKKNLERHLNTHRAKVKRVECDHCGVRFLNKKYLTNHIQRKHGRKGQKYICDICGLVTTNKPSIVMHIKYGHKRMYKTKCKLCDMRFQRASYLKKHCWNIHKFDYKIPKRQKKKPKKTTVIVKEEPHDEFVEENQLFNLIPKQEPPDDEDMLLADLAASGEHQLADIPEGVFDELIHPTTRTPDRVIRPKLDHIRKRADKYLIDKKSEAQAKKRVTELLERTRRKAAADALERTRRKYNRLMRKAVEKSSIKDRRKITYYNNKKTTNSLLVEKNHNTIERENLRVIDKTNKHAANLDKAIIQNARDKIRFGKESNDLLVEDFSIDHDAIKNIDQEVIANADQTQDKQIKEKDTMRFGKESHNALVEDFSIDHDAVENIDQDIIDTTIDNIANKDQSTRKSKDSTKFKRARSNNLLVEDFSIDHDAIENIDQEIIDKTIEVTAKADQTTRKDNDSIKRGQERDTTMLVDNFRIDHDAINIEDQEITDQTNEILANDDQTTRVNKGNSKFRKARNNNSLAEDFLIDHDTIDDVDQEIDETNEVIANAHQVDNQTVEEIDKQVKQKGANELKSRNNKLKLNIQQCYVCFKLFETKDKLLDHCKDHFDLSNVKTLKKCPLCRYSTSLSVTKHLKKAHNIDVKVPYGKFKDDNKDVQRSKYYYDVGDEIINKVEIIPSVKNLNRLESKKIDKAKRDDQNKGVTKTKLVKKGKEWIVVKEKVKIKDCLLPKLDEVDNLNAKGGYIERMKELYRVSKKKGVKMLFPCESCDKVCQTLSALKLHGRKHEANPKPYKPKVWKHKLKVKPNNNSSLDTSVAKAKHKQANEAKIQAVINKQNLELPKLDRRTRQAQNESYKEANRTSKPKPIVNKHRCEKELKEFYERNIKGGDIEFWQFLKIYNKMGRENVNDFSDLEKTREFGFHSEPASNNTEVEKDVGSKVSVTNKITRKLAFKKAKLSRKEFQKKRNEIKRRLREKIKLRELAV